MSSSKQTSSARTKLQTKGVSHQYSVLIHPHGIVSSNGADQETTLSIESFLMQSVVPNIRTSDLLVVRIRLFGKPNGLAHSLLGPLEIALRSAIAAPCKPISRKKFEVEILAFHAPVWQIGDVPKKPASAGNKLDEILSGSPSLTTAAKALQDAFLDATTDVTPKFNHWLKSLEGQRFDDKVASARVATINNLTAALGRELVFEGHRVRLFARIRSNTKTAVIRVVTNDGDRPVELWNRVTLPALSTRPLSLK